MRNTYISPGELAAVASRLNGRDRLLTAILRKTGFRLDDIMHTRVWQWRREAVTLCERKTGKRRTVALSPDLQGELRAAFAARHGLEYAFPALRRCRARKMHRTTYWRHFIAAVRAAGLEGRGITPHSLRKLYAVERLRSTGSLSAVQADLNHSRPEVTAIYAFADKFR